MSSAAAGKRAKGSRGFSAARGAALVAVAVLGTSILAGCQSHVGVAASVGSHRIHDTDLNGYLLVGGPSPSASAAASSTSRSPRSTALSTLVQQELLTQVLAANGGVPAAGDLTALRAAALSSAGVTDASLDTALASDGLTPRFGEAFLRTLELRQVIQQRKPSTIDAPSVAYAALVDYVKANSLTATAQQEQQLITQLGTTEDQIVAHLSASALGLPTTLQTQIKQAFAAAHAETVVKIVQDLGITVKVNGRYGVWDPTTFSLSQTALPAYLSVTTPSPAAASGTPSQ